MSVVLYARGASAESVQKQFAELRRFAGAQGWRVVGEFNDVATHGTSLERAGLHQLRAQVESPSREFEVVLVTTIDRLAREFYHSAKIFCTNSAPMPKRTAKAKTKPRTQNKGSAAIRSAEEGEEMSKDLSQYVTTKQAAELMGVSQDHVNYLLITGRLRGVKPGGWNWLVYVPSIKKYAETKSVRGRPRSKALAELNATNGH